jgi:hypothetical protein
MDHPLPGLPDWGSLRIETVKCGLESRGTRTRDRLSWRGTATNAKKKKNSLTLFREGAI